MYFLTAISTLFYISIFTIGGIATVTSSYPKSINIASGRPLNNEILIVISTSTIKEL